MQQENGIAQDVRIVVFDDDPTGIQTVFGNLLLTEWNAATLQQALRDEVRFFYILTNTRAMTSQAARDTIHSAATAVLEANRDLKSRLIFMSRSDSTLRSHFPVEIDELLACRTAAGEPEPQARFLVPAFFEGGRVTMDNTHYLREDARLLPTAQTEFARDSVFGYPTSHLPGYIEYKTAGRVAASSVQSVTLEMVRQWPADALESWLADLNGGRWCVVNAENYQDLDRFTRVLRNLICAGHSYLFQCAASLVKSLTQTPDRPLLDGRVAARKGPGLVIVGSHVGKTTQQLQALLAHEKAAGIEIDVRRILETGNRAASEIGQRVADAYAAGRTPVIFTTRTEMNFNSTAQRLAAGKTISNFLSRIVREIPFSPSFIIAKGGITSHDVLVDGLEIEAARTAGQISPGVPVVTLPPSHRFACAPYVIFPGNVGGPNALRDIFQTLSGDES